MFDRLTHQSRSNGVELLLHAKNRDQIPNVRLFKEDIPEKIDQVNRIHKQSHPNAQYMGRTAMYNCMGLVFASRRTCIDIDQARSVLSMDGYVPLNGIDATKVGDIVLYVRNGTPMHVGVIVSKYKGEDIYSVNRETIKVLSKWGDAGEYLHDIDDLPENFGRSTEYFTDGDRFDTT